MDSFEHGRWSGAEGAEAALADESTEVILLPARTDEEWQRRQEFQRQFALANVSADQQRRLAWDQLIDAWIETKGARSQSESTRANYREALRRWQGFLATQFVDGRTVELWEVDASHVRGWQASMRARELSEVTINHQLSCVSSFYSYVIAEKRMWQGVEIDMFVDRLGRARTNPFKTGNIQRGRTESYERARPLTLAEYSQLLDYLEANSHTLAGARNFALILTYLHTGWRSSELLRMQWRDIRPSRVKKEQWVFAWRGKGAKKQDDLLPADCFNAIVGYLKKAGRWTPGVPGRESGLANDEFVWLPVSAPDMSGLRHGPEVDEERSITEKSALRILRSALRQAGIKDAHLFRVHDLRHTHASLLLQSGQNLATVQARLHHSSLATTGIYVKQAHRDDPVDSFSAQFRQLRLQTA